LANALGSLEVLKDDAMVKVFFCFWLADDILRKARLFLAEAFG